MGHHHTLIANNEAGKYPSSLSLFIAQRIKSYARLSQRKITYDPGNVDGTALTELKIAPIGNASNSEHW